MVIWRYALAALAATGTLSVPAKSIPVQQSAKLSQQDVTAISVLEQSVFDKLEKSGTEQLFLDFGVEMTAETTAETRKIDKGCGKVQDVQLVNSTSRGSRYAEKWYLSTHEGCMLHWKVSYKREQAQWQVSTLNFDTNVIPY